MSVSDHYLVYYTWSRNGFKSPRHKYTCIKFKSFRSFNFELLLKVSKVTEHSAVWLHFKKIIDKPLLDMRQRKITRELPGNWTTLSSRTDSCPAMREQCNKLHCLATIKKWLFDSKANNPCMVKICSNQKGNKAMTQRFCDLDSVLVPIFRSKMQETMCVYLCLKN